MISQYTDDTQLYVSVHLMTSALLRVLLFTRENSEDTVCET